MMSRWSTRLGRLYDGLALIASLLLLALMAVICTDVTLRNVPLIPGVRGLSAASDFSEAALYLITLLAAPWLLRRGQHIRVDIVLRALPPSWAWLCEWAVDALGIGCCLVMAWYSFGATRDSYTSGEMFIKALATPVWWWLSVLPITFGLLAIEFVFRMERLARGQRGPRDEAVSAG